eukprot:358386-Chlamydomonas_euryale.AAC.1
MISERSASHAPHTALRIMPRQAIGIVIPCRGGGVQHARGAVQEAGGPRGVQHASDAVEEACSDTRRAACKRCGGMRHLMGHLNSRPGDHLRVHADAAAQTPPSNHAPAVVSRRAEHGVAEVPQRGFDRLCDARATPSACHHRLDRSRGTRGAEIHARQRLWVWRDRGGGGQCKVKVDARQRLWVWRDRGGGQCKVKTDARQRLWSGHGLQARAVCEEEGGWASGGTAGQKGAAVWTRASRRNVGNLHARQCQRQSPREGEGGEAGWQGPGMGRGEERGGKAPARLAPPCAHRAEHTHRLRWVEVHVKEAGRACIHT